MALAFEKHETNPFVDVVLRTHPGDWAGIDRSIDSRDEMLEFAIEAGKGDRDAALASYFTTGLEQLEVIRWCKESHFGADEPVEAMLDFASGYGRLTRFLVHAGLARELHVSDILTEAMKFQEEQFGVRAILSVTNPDELVLDRKYDLITVASLFTHLPAKTFRAWLARLVSSLTPGGLLIFSVHDESLGNLDLGDSLHFAAASESKTLDVNEYGSTWVSETYVRNSLASVDPALRYVRLPRALSGFQDIYVTGLDLDVESMSKRESVQCFFEACSPSPESVFFRGWATEVARPVERVDLLLDGELIVSLTELGERPDVGGVLGTPGALKSGWGFEIPAEKISSFHTQVVSIVAVGHGGVRRTVFIGTVAMAAMVGLEATVKTLLAAGGSRDTTSAGGLWSRVKKVLGL